MLARCARRTFVPLLFIFACSLIFGVSSASAGIAWCRSDPVVVIDGQLADIFVASDLAMQFKSTGPLQLVIALPPSSTGSVVLSDTGFGLHGYDVRFVTDASLTRTNRHTQVRVAVYAPATDSTLPVQVTFAPRDLTAGLTAILFGTSANGFANNWVSLIT